jgi:hypothetical protein
MAEPGITRDWHQISPFATSPPPQLRDLQREGAVRFLLVAGERDDSRGGFLVAPESLWQGSELVRSYRGALAREWTPERIYRYWKAEAGNANTFMIDPEERAGSLDLVARRVGI